MKIKLLARSRELYESNAASGSSMRLRNIDPSLNPMATMREYQRAVQAAKIKRIFAKPFVHSFVGHLDTVKALTRCRTNTADFFSGSCDGEIRMYNLTKRSCERALLNVHEGFINGLTTSNDDRYLYSAGQDGVVHQWNCEKYFDVRFTDNLSVNHTGDLVLDASISSNEIRSQIRPSASFLSSGVLNSIDYSHFGDKFITAGNQIQLWDVNMTEPVSQFAWGSDQYVFARCSPSEPNIFLATAFDNAVTIFDMRMNDAVQKISLNMRSTAACYNPMRPFEFSVANDDSNIYAFDLRQLASARTIHAGFVRAALDIDYSPTGQELCGGSFDQTVRIWKVGNSRAREIYHNKRMQAVFQTKYSGDSKYILTGSADMNIRVWKSDCSMIERTLNQRERNSVNYRAALIEKFMHVPEVRRINNQRHVPKYIQNQTRKRYISAQAERRKEENRVANNPALAQRGALKSSMIKKVEFADLKQTGHKCDASESIVEEISNSKNTKKERKEFRHNIVVPK